MQAMKATIRKRSKLKAKSATDIEQQQMFKTKYPTWTNILTSFGDEEINCALAEFLVLIIQHTEGLFKLAPERLPEDYDETVDGEIDSQLFPNFPILRQRAFYEKECLSLRWQISEVNVQKKIPNPFCSFSWADGHDMRLSKKGCVWYFAHDKRRISPNELRRHNVKISAWLLPEHHLW